MEDRYVVLGAGGHSKIILNILCMNGKNIQGLTDVSYKDGDLCMGYPLLGTDDILEELYKDGVRCAAIGIGHVGNPRIRNNVYAMAKNIGFSFPNIIHSSATVADTVILGEGNLLSAGCIINPDSCIGDICIINTGAVIEHDVIIGKGVHIAPHSTVLGAARIGDDTLIGAGSTIIQGVTIGRNCIIGAGAVVLEDIEDNSVIVGNPGRLIKRR